MPAFTASAPGKVILFGEHAVVYGRPAIAVPVIQVKARAVVTADLRGEPGVVKIQAPDIGLETNLSGLPDIHPIAVAIRGVFTTLNVNRRPACVMRITSSIPVAAGLGSGAAVSVAITRSLSAFLGSPLPDERVSALAYEVEKLYHGTPSGIDNTVITYGKPVYFVRQQPIVTFAIKHPFTIVIADTGIRCPTSVPVGEVRKAWQADPEGYETFFDSAGEIAEAARRSIESGEIERLGMLMDSNHVILGEMGVSSPELDRLVDAAHAAGAMGAKLSGAGQGGNIIALVTDENADRVAQTLQEAGAQGTIITHVGT
jgi:mevalonate kinase